MARVKYRNFALLIVMLLSACISAPVKQHKDRCMSLQSMKARFSCYQTDIMDQISSQVSSDYRDYISDVRKPDDVEIIEEFNGVTVRIELFPTGYVKRVIFLEAGRNSFFDNMIERAVKNAGPFFLPADQHLQKMLSEFQYSIEVE